MIAALVAIGGAVLVLGVVVMMVVGNKTWRGNTIHRPGGSGSAAGPPIGKADRPAGPGAETMKPERLGGDQDPPRS